MERGHLSASSDAVAKAVHFKNAGAAQASIPGTTTTFLGELAAGVQEDFAAGRLVSKAMQTKAAVQAAENAAAGTESVLPSCTTTLTCNREEAAARGATDIFGQVGTVCAHIFPLLGLFLAMSTPEQHYYYDVLFASLIAASPHISAIYLDLGCRYKKRFKILLADLVARGEISESRAGSILLLLPWMHGYDHDEACQIANSGLYQVGSSLFGAQLLAWGSGAVGPHPAVPGPLMYLYLCAILNLRYVFHPQHTVTPEMYILHLLGPPLDWPAQPGTRLRRPST